MSWKGGEGVLTFSLAVGNDDVEVELFVGVFPTVFESIKGR